MSPEGISTISERNRFLLTFFSEEFVNPNPKWQEIDSATAHWRVAVVSEEGKRIIATRIPEIGKVDHFCIYLDKSGEDTHFEVDWGSSLTGAIENTQAQADLGLTTPNDDESGLFNELVDVLRLVNSV